MKKIRYEMLRSTVCKGLPAWSITSVGNPFFVMALLGSLLFSACSSGTTESYWDYNINFEEEEEVSGMMVIKQSGDTYQVSLKSFKEGTRELTNVEFSEGKLSGNLELWEDEYFSLEGAFEGDKFTGTLRMEEESFPFVASKLPNEPYAIDRSQFEYLLPASALPDSEADIDHAGIIESLDGEALARGARIYNSNCINCHGTPEVEGSIPLSHKFWEKKPYKAGSDLYSMYLALTRGVGSMPPQVALTPREKYDVILYVQENFLKEYHPEAYVPATPAYLAGLPEGSSRGPDAKPYHPWSDMDYGNFFINTYELADEETGPERYHSPGPTPFADEDYLENNFAYKGIAIRLDEGPGGVSKGKAWMIFDHDVMRVAGGWTGDGFIDWEGILLNDQHETYPRTIGRLHFETPVGPGWANPSTGSFEDPRFVARDGRAFGPLPGKWADYKGLYHHGGHIIISYTVGTAKVLERLGMEKMEGETVFTRTLNISPSASILKMRVAPAANAVALSGEGASLSEEEGFMVLKARPSTLVKVKIFIAAPSVNGLESFARSSAAPESLEQYTKGGPAHYPEVLSSSITTGMEDGPFAVDQLTPPFDNPWDARMKLSGIDFLKDANKAVACTADGDVFLITGLTDNSGQLSWKRIAAGLFQPLGIKVLDGLVYVICRDQLVRLRDFNGDDETDFYESFNHDHQVTDHFHEFAMGLQADEEGNLYYAKSGRHAREALVPRHGTLIKVSPDGSKSEIIATGFRAANGVCLNPDGSFIVTDQQGYWNPMNRINWVDGDGKFYGNMWGYNPPKDTTRAAMEPPLVWVDMEFDRSPSELLWVDSEKWGPLNGSLLSFSYGYGKIQLVLHEKVNGQRQGGVIDLPGTKFLTGVMRGRFNPEDGHLYACGMSAWGTSQMMRPGDLYRVRYTGKPLPVPIGLKAQKSGMELTFASTLDAAKAEDAANYEVQTWELLRSSEYGSDRYNEQKLTVSKAELQPDGKSVKLFLEGIKPVDVMTISYDITDGQGNAMKGTVQNTIHRLGQNSRTLGLNQ